MPEPEASPRLAQQLEQLAHGSALLDGRSDVNSSDVALAERVALDSIRADRRAILDSIGAEELSIKALENATRLSQASVSRRVEELHGLGLVEWERSADFDKSSVRLTEHARQLFAGTADD
jgi:DNA-binding MarR family transcriptional regulator